MQLEGICAKDVRDGNLKAILGLFFALSRHKQQQKQLSQVSHPADGAGTLVAVREMKNFKKLNKIKFFVKF